MFDCDSTVLSYKKNFEFSFCDLMRRDWKNTEIESDLYHFTYQEIQRRGLC